MKKKYFNVNIVIAFLFFATSVMAQKQISGNVNSADGQPLPGVSILVKGTTNGTSTDFDGNYAISNVADNATLVFSYLGFKTKEVLVGSQSTINVSLEEDIATLDDVIVVGYGTKKKLEVAGAVAQISGELTKRSPEVNFTTSLAGRLPGLAVTQTGAQPGRENIDISIRGTRTFDSDTSDGIDPTQPLIVVDGVIGADGLGGLNSDDIESVSILKDASASVYGSRAANGVILITTKRGKTGKPVFNYTINTGILSPTRFPERASALEFATMSRAILDRDPSANVISFTDQEIAEFGALGFRSTDWYREIFDRTSVQTRHNISFRGGTESVSYFTSLSAAQREGIVVQDNVTDVGQYNFRSNIDVNASDRIKVSLNLAGRYGKNQFFGASPGDVSNAAAKGLPFETSTTADGRPLRLRLTNLNLNPLAIVRRESGYQRERNSLFNAKLGLTYKIPGIEGLSAEVWGAARFRQDYRKQFDRSFLQYDIDGNGNIVEDIVNRDVKVTEDYERDLELTGHINLRYANVFGKHSVGAFAAIEQSEQEFNSSGLSRRDFLASTIDQLFAGGTQNQTTGGFAFESSRLSYIGTLSYDFNKKYFLDFGFRYEGSFNFDEGRNFGFFPSIQGAWRLSEENFLKDNSTISNLKLKGTWGKVGNDLIPQFQYLNRFGNDGSFPIGTGTLTNLPIVGQIGTIANPFVTWETADQINIGLELGLFSNKLTLELDYFTEKREDILAPRRVSIPLYTGVTPSQRPNENIGKVESKSFEAIIGYRTQIGKVNFSAEGNIAYAQNELVFKDAVEPAEPYQNLEGRPIGSRLVYNAIGIYGDQTDLDNNPGLAGAGIGDLIYADTNEDGVIDANDRIAWEPDPSIQFGLNLGFDYSNFELSMLFQGVANATATQSAIFGEGDFAYILRNAYTPANPNASLPRLGATESARNGYLGGDNATNFWIRDASFVRLRNIQLAYNVPQDITSKVGLSAVRLYVSGSNLITFDKFKKDGLGDPEQGIGVLSSIPLQKIVNFGANITF
ncbi:TonB-dependent receptor [Sabulilitoribacter arenilitoris]|uniref:TonB-dependent receptor n=1 Tax=Wocania arenilitoris TaxID=2044858 RepID=A0AAE3EQ21_9FLAO|nr:TonB-dependent receptor [Wocania arenilitoris]MCF7567975.1 TonB-dependent receptor [Wocania arenilitoris]